MTRSDRRSLTVNGLPFHLESLGFAPTKSEQTNNHVQFRRADGDPSGLAGFCNTSINKTTGEVHESYTMLTINADDHPLMRHMYKPAPKAPMDRQSKRSVIPLEAEDFDQ